MQRQRRYQHYYARLLASANRHLPRALGPAWRVPRGWGRAARVSDEVVKEIWRRAGPGPIPTPLAWLFWGVFSPLSAFLTSFPPLLRALSRLAWLLSPLLEALTLLEPPRPARCELERAPPQPPPLVIFPTIQINAPNGL